MKRFILVLLALFLFSSLLFANMTAISGGVSGGYSSAYSLPSFGFNSSYTYYVDLNPSAFIGANTHIDLGLHPTDKQFNVSLGVLCGPSFGYAINPSNFISVSVGPAFYTEFGDANSSSYWYMGLGLGADANYSFFFGESKSLGITVGATGYFPMLDMIKPNSLESGFKYDVIGYLAFTYRFGDDVASLLNLIL